MKATKSKKIFRIFNSKYRSRKFLMSNSNEIIVNKSVKMLTLTEKKQNNLN